jgi:hypothetical protein
MKITTHDAIQSLRPNIGFSMQGDDPLTIIWDIPNTTTPTDVEIAAALKSLEAKRIKDAADKAIAKKALLERLGITADEAALLLG